MFTVLYMHTCRHRNVFLPCCVRIFLFFPGTNSLSTQSLFQVVLLLNHDINKRYFCIYCVRSPFSGLRANGSGKTEELISVYIVAYRSSTHNLRSCHSSDKIWINADLELTLANSPIHLRG